MGDVLKGITLRNDIAMFLTMLNVKPCVRWNLDVSLSIMRRVYKRVTGTL